MKAKLIKGKESGEYLLKMGGVGYITTYESTLPYKLSLKNCQAIERGYDLDELAEKNYPTINLPLTDTTAMNSLKQDSFKEGFQKALSILGDKKFSEEDMIKCFNASMDKGWVRADFYIQSLQQTEWDVEIIEQCLDPTCDGVNRKGECITTGKPKLDADGCLILKRIDDE